MTKTGMQRIRLKEIIDRLLHEIEEEDIGISLFTTCYQNLDELKFFKDEDREQVCKILKKVSEDSKRHKEILEKLIAHLGERCFEK